MKYFKLFEQFIAEGGWASTKTQSTVIKPKIIADSVSKLKIIQADFAKHCEKQGLPLLDFGKPVGSGSWYEDDIISQPDKVYGDVDFIISYPTLELDGKNERANEIATVKLYNQELLAFLENQNYSFIDFEETDHVSTPDSIKLIMEVSTPEGSGWIQVDIIVTHVGYKDWSIFRLTPIRNVKGFVLGNLYSAFGEVLEVSIQPKGVRARFSGTEMVAYSKRSAEDKIISVNVNTFMHDIARFFWEQSGTEKPYQDSETLKRWKGINPNNPTFEDMCNGIIGVADTLEKLGEFGTIIKYKSAQQLINAIKDRFIEKMEKAAASGKFAKAETPAAIAAAEKVKKLVAEYIDKINALL